MRKRTVMKDNKHFNGEAPTVKAVLLKSALFAGVGEKALDALLAETPLRVADFAKGDVIFHMMDDATVVGIVIDGRVEAQKSFPGGSQVNVSVKGPGELIGPAAVFSESHRYPCDMVALTPSTIMLIGKNALLALMRRDVIILENMMTEIASAAFMLQQRLELLSYRGIAQKAAFWLLMAARREGSSRVSIPGSMTQWALTMNVSRTSLHRELKRLCDRGIIAYHPPVIEILDSCALEAVLGD